MGIYGDEYSSSCNGGQISFNSAWSRLQALSIAGSQAEKLPAGLISPCTMQENQPSAVSSNIDTAAGHKT